MNFVYAIVLLTLTTLFCFWLNLVIFYMYSCNIQIVNGNAGDKVDTNSMKICSSIKDNLIIRVTLQLLQIWRSSNCSTRMEINMKQAGAELCQALAKLAWAKFKLGYNWIHIGWELNYSGWWLVAGWLAGKELIIRLTQSSWAGAGTELGNYICLKHLTLSALTKCF
jgi:hypothetical protein